MQFSAQIIISTLTGSKKVELHYVSRKRKKTNCEFSITTFGPTVKKQFKIHSNSLSQIFPLLILTKCTTNIIK